MAKTPSGVSSPRQWGRCWQHSQVLHHEADAGRHGRHVGAVLGQAVDVAENVVDTTLSLPLFPGLSDNEISRILAALSSIE